jgi:hypothetical protein
MPDLINVSCFINYFDFLICLYFISDFLEERAYILWRRSQDDQNVRKSKYGLLKKSLLFIKGQKEKYLLYLYEFHYSERRLELVLKGMQGVPFKMQPNNNKVLPYKNEIRRKSIAMQQTLSASPMTLDSRSPLLLGCCTQQLQESCGGLSIYSQADCVCVCVNSWTLLYIYIHICKAHTYVSIYMCIFHRVSVSIKEEDTIVLVCLYLFLYQHYLIVRNTRNMESYLLL